MTLTPEELKTPCSDIHPGTDWFRKRNSFSENIYMPQEGSCSHVNYRLIFSPKKFLKSESIVDLNSSRIYVRNDPLNSGEKFWCAQEGEGH